MRYLLTLSFLMKTLSRENRNRKRNWWISVECFCILYTFWLLDKQIVCLSPANECFSKYHGCFFLSLARSRSLSLSWIRPSIRQMELFDFTVVTITLRTPNCLWIWLVHAHRKYIYTITIESCLISPNSDECHACECRSLCAKEKDMKRYLANIIYIISTHTNARPPNVQTDNISCIKEQSPEKLKLKQQIFTAKKGRKKREGAG